MFYLFIGEINLAKYLRLVDMILSLGSFVGIIIILFIARLVDLGSRKYFKLRIYAIPITSNALSRLPS